MGVPSVISEFTTQSIYRIDESTERILKCLDVLSADQIWQKPNEQLNSIGNLILHLEGNITQYICSSLGKQPDQRKRDNEFSSNEKLSKEVLISRITSFCEKAKSVLRNISVEEIQKTRFVQGFELSGIGIILHVVEHYSYHVGQISLLTKLYTNKDLGYYANFDLNTKNEI